MTPVQLSVRIVSMPNVPLADGIYPDTLDFVLQRQGPVRVMKLALTPLKPDPRSPDLVWVPEHARDLCAAKLHRVDLQGDPQDREMLFAAQMSNVIYTSLPDNASRLLLLFTHAMPAEPKSHAYVGAICWLEE